MEWQSYEQLTASIYEALGKANGVTIECYGAQCKVTGKSGAQHQIDVLVKHSNGLQIVRTAIECKYWNKKVNKPVISTLAGYIQDAGIEKGVVVSKLGFTEQAIQLAAQMNIGLVELREPIEVDWEGAIREVHVKINMSSPDVYDLEVLQESEPDSESKKEQYNVHHLSFVKIVDPRQGEHTLEEIIERELKRDFVEDEAIDITFSTGTIMKLFDEERHAEVTGIRFKVRYLHATTNFSVNAADHIYMLMKDVFGKREFMLDHEGNLTERDLEGYEALI